MVNKTQILDFGEILPLYNISNESPRNFETNIMKLQNEFINLRKTNKGPPLSINKKLVQLESIALSKLLSNDKSKYSKLMAWSAMNLGEFYNLFIDSNITEAFCNNIGDRIIVTHRLHGRCFSNQLFREEFWRSLKLQAELNAKRILSPINPTIKTGLRTELGNFRVSLQIPPRTAESPAFNIRRLPKKPITIEQLIAQGQIKKFIVDKLINAVKQRKNVIIAGEPGSGKTTLANALLLMCEASWRLIIVEDASEINIPAKILPMAVRFSMPSIGNDNQYLMRTNEIAKLLHRSPDYVFLGEIQNAQDTKIAFEGFAAGLRGMATTHARNFEGLLSRWKNSHNLQEELIKAIDFIVITRRDFIDNKFILITTNLFELVNGKLSEVNGN